MKATIKDFIGSALVLIEGLCFVLIFGFVGGLDQDAMTVGECAKRVGIIGVVMLAVGLALFFLCKNDDRD